jgi:hypothetical protein
MHRFYNFHPDSRSVYNVLGRAWNSAKNSFSPLPTSIPLHFMFPARPVQNAPQEAQPVNVPPPDLESQNDNNWNVNNTQGLQSLQRTGSGHSEELSSETSTAALAREEQSRTKIDTFDTKPVPGIQGELQGQGQQQESS